MYMKTLIDVDDEALAAAARALGTITKKDTVNAALRLVAKRRERVAEIIDGPRRFGVGSDITDPEVMASARR